MHLSTIFILLATASHGNCQFFRFGSDRIEKTFSALRPIGTHCAMFPEGRRCTTESSTVAISTSTSTQVATSTTSNLPKSASVPTSNSKAVSTSSTVSSTTKKTSSTISKASSSSTSKTSSSISKSSSSSTSYTRGPNYGPALISWTQSAGFPTGVFTSYYMEPAATAEPQPAIYDSSLGMQYPLDLTDPATIGARSTNGTIAYPAAMGNYTNGTAIQDWAVNQVRGILNGTARISGNCSRCIAALEVGQKISQEAPQNFPLALAALCETMGYMSKKNCNSWYGPGARSTAWNVILQHADVNGLDGQWICALMFDGEPGSPSFCSAPGTITQSTQGLVKTPKPSNAIAPPRSGKTVKVTHLSDIHLDARYAVGSETLTNCGPAGCCRPDSTNGTAANPATLYGAYPCDAPYNLLVSALESIGPMTGNSKNSRDDGIAFSIFTGDLMPHEKSSQFSSDFLFYNQAAVYQMLKYFLPNAPTYAVQGNHDTGAEAFDTHYSLPGTWGDMQALLYKHSADLWQAGGDIDATAASDVKTHFAAYSINHPKYPKLKIVALNTDFWLSSNAYNYVNSANPDSSGIFTFLVDKLQAAEDAGQRVWILGHVPSGWGGGGAMPSHTDLFYQVVERYSPHVIANIFFGHTHADQLTIYYANNGTNLSAETALTQAWIAPSITPHTNLNSAWRFYEVDTGDFNIYDAYTFYTDVSKFDALDVTKSGPNWELLYSTRQAYGDPIKWPQDAPLNATFWHEVTEEMSKNKTMVNVFNTYATKNSVMSSPCSSTHCQWQLICHMQSGTVAQGYIC